jgi:hypothetical protein
VGSKTYPQVIVHRVECDVYYANKELWKERKKEKETKKDLV